MRVGLESVLPGPCKSLAPQNHHLSCFPGSCQLSTSSPSNVGVAGTIYQNISYPKIGGGGCSLTQHS